MLRCIRIFVVAESIIKKKKNPYPFISTKWVIIILRHPLLPLYPPETLTRHWPHLNCKYLKSSWYWLLLIFFGKIMAEISFTLRANCVVVIQHSEHCFLSCARVPWLCQLLLGYQYWVSYGWRQVSLGVAVSRLQALYITSRTVAS